MLETRERTLLLESLRPPVGYRLDQAIGTSYSLDLMALLTAPLAFTFFNYHNAEGEPSADPVALLEALRRHAESITIFCQAGNIYVPRPQQTLLAYLESSVIGVEAPRKGGIFHPKVWVLRFVAADQPVRHRLLCLTRNLTFDRAWDTCLALEGELTGRKLGFSKNRPLGEFLEALPAMAVQRVAPTVGERVELLASEIRRVKFEAPTPFKDFAFFPLGLGRSTPLPFPEGSQLLVMAPYLSGEALELLARDHDLKAVISRPEALAKIRPELLPGGNTFVLHSAADLDAREGGEESGEKKDTEISSSGVPEAETELHGLHAKLYVADEGHWGHVFTGSANATAAGLQRNVELLVELVGGKWLCGIDAILGLKEKQPQDSLRSLLQEYQPPPEPEEENEIQKALDLEVQRLAQGIASRSLQARVTSERDDQVWTLTLSGSLPPRPEHVRVTVWPATLPAASQQRADSESRVIAQFEGLSFEAITAFWAFEIEARKKDEIDKEYKSSVHRFVATAKLLGAPADRRERLLRSMLKNRRQVLRLLLLLLSDDELDVVQLADLEDSTGERWTGRFAGWDEPALLEALLQGLARSPERLDQAARLIADLRRTPEGAELLPERLSEIWEPVWKARKGTRT